MAAFTFPGVYIEEISSGQHSITGVATSIAAFIGWSNRGPVDEAVRVESWSEYEALFGGMIPGVYLGYAVYQFFQNGGSQAYIVRLCDSTAGAASASIGGLTFNASNPGGWGNNIAVSISGINAVNGTFNLQVFQLRGTGQLAQVESYTNLSVDPSSGSYAATVINNDSNFIALPTSTPPATLPLSGPSAPYYLLQGAPSPISVGDKVQQSGSGAQGTVVMAPTTSSLVVLITSGTIRTTSTSDTWTDVSNPANVFTQNALPVASMALISGAITGTFAAGEVVTQLQPGGSSATAVYVSSIGTPPEDFATPGLLVVAGLTGTANSFSQWKGSSGATCSPISGPVSTTAMPLVAASPTTAGADGPTLTPDGTTKTQFLNQLLNTPGTGLSLLGSVPIFNLLCVPGESDLVAVSAMQAFCAANRAFLIVDAAQDAVLGTVTSGLSATGPADSTGASLVNPSAGNSAFYFPWVQAPDPLAGFRPAYFPPCGFVAGIYATTDATRGVWKAPAGIDASLTGALGLQYTLNDLQNGSLNVLGVNCLRQFPNFGNVVWGARTIAGNDSLGSQWKYVPIRRLALFLESSLYEGTQWAVFEPNAEPLWGQVRLSIGSFLQGLFLKGAFAGTTPQQAYFVKCDGDNNPPASQALGMLNIAVGFAPLYPAEFVVIQIQQIMNQS
jgi:phage tail sheath protein FI